MANFNYSHILISFFLLFSLTEISLAAESTTNKTSQIDEIKKSLIMQYHNGPLLNGQLTIILIWYGKFNPPQRSTVTDFLNSLYKPAKSMQDRPDVMTWWKKIDRYYDINLKVANKAFNLTLSLGTQINDENCSLGKKLTNAQIIQLASKGAQKDAINIVLTSSDVSVDGFCTKCGIHDSAMGTQQVKNGMNSKFAYIWVGNSETQCPDKCAWPLKNANPGSKSKLFVSPNNDLGIDGMIIHLSNQLAATATNPFGDGYFEGTKEDPKEAASACEGIFARGSYSGYPGNLLVDGKTGASYNAQGINGRKYLLPAIFDPKTQFCSTLV